MPTQASSTEVTGTQADPSYRTSTGMRILYPVAAHLSPSFPKPLIIPIHASARLTDASNLHVVPSASEQGTICRPVVYAQDPDLPQIGEAAFCVCYTYSSDNNIVV